MGTAFFALTTVGCLAVLAVDAVPGLSGTLLLCPCVGCFVQLIAAYLWGSTAYQLLHRPDLARAKVIASVAVVGLSAVAWIAEVPKRIALACVVHEFEAKAAELADLPDHRGGPGWVGWYWVDRSESDGEGRAYFRTASHGDGIGPDEVSYGFAKIPPRANRNVRSPFGAARYAETWLFGDWYFFSTSNDYCPPIFAGSPDFSSRREPFAYNPPSDGRRARARLGCDIALTRVVSVSARLPSAGQ